MRCPGCGARVSVDVGIHGAQDLLVEVASGRYHDSTRCHAAEPVRKAAREVLLAWEAPGGLLAAQRLERAIAALRAALEG